jgi:TPR repeat protein
VFLANGTGVKQDIEAAIKWFEVAAEAGIAAAPIQLGRLFANGSGITRDNAKAEQWLERASNSGDPEAKVAHAMFLLQSDKSFNAIKRATELLMEAVKADHVPASLQLGHLFAGRFGVKAFMPQAVRWYGQAAEAGSVEAMFALGQLHLDRDPASGVRDAKLAANHFERAARAGHALAQFQLGVMYCTGEGVEKDLTRGVAWYEAAAKQGHALGQFNLAVMLSKGQGCELDLKKAAAWFESAAEQGMAAAQLALGDALASGAGVDKDIEAARPWYEKAAQQGNEVARQRLNANGTGEVVGIQGRRPA